MSLYCLKSDTENGLLTLPKGKWQRYIQVFLLPKGLTLVANIQQTLVAIRLIFSRDMPVPFS